MPVAAPIPSCLTDRVFTLAEARAAGVSEKMLRGRRFRRLHRGVYVLADHPMEPRDWRAAARLLDILIAADWLVHHGHTTLAEVLALLDHEPWRPGALAVRRVLDDVDGRAASPKETEARVLLVYAGLPRPEVNAPLFDGPLSPVNDLLYRAWDLALEYEGSQHFGDPTQIRRDIGRDAIMRQRGCEYVQVYDEILGQPRVSVMDVYRRLCERGYRGPAPRFGRRWRSLFEPFRRFRG